MTDAYMTRLVYRVLEQSIAKSLVVVVVVVVGKHRDGGWGKHTLRRVVDIGR